jgi:hypothetical protein
MSEFRGVMLVPVETLRGKAWVNPAMVTYLLESKAVGARQSPDGSIIESEIHFLGGEWVTSTEAPAHVVGRLL